MREENHKLNLKEREGLLERLESKPFLLRFAFSENCNLRCSYCRGEWVKSGYLPFSVVRALDGVFPYVKKVWLFGNGEPLMHPEFREISEHIASFGVDVCFLTNGQLIDDALARRWVEKGISHVRISIDAATAGTYEKLRVGGSFAKLLAAVKSINKWKDELGAGKPEIGFNFTAMRENVEELPALVELAAQLRVGDVGVTYMRNFHSYELTGSSLFFHQELSDEMMGLAVSAAGRLGVRIVTPELFGRAPAAAGEPRTCTEPWSTALIYQDGGVYGCGCCGFGMPPAGNLNETPFEEIWNGPVFRGLRRSVNSANPPALCRNCLDDSQKRDVLSPAGFMDMSFHERYTSGG